MKQEDERRLEDFKKKIGYDEPVSREELKKALESNMRDRALYAYFIWKAIAKKHPEDADDIMRDAMHSYGLYKSPSLGTVNDALDGMLNQTSKNGMIAFEQTFEELNEERAEKHIHNCPLVNAFREVATPEETVKLCSDILACSDFALLEPYADKVELSFPKTLSTDDVCVMCVKKK